MNFLPLADESIFFAFFMPGHPSLIDIFMDKAKENQNLVVRGVVSSPASMPDATQLFHRNGDEPVVVPATAYQKDFGDFERELLSLGFAIIHLKKFVINMFGKNPIVGGGSHNGGQRASTFNDENMEIWIGNRPLALKVGVYILSLYRHYRERYLMSKQASAFSGFLKTDSSWIDAQEWTPGTAKCREKALFAGAVAEFDDPAFAVKGESTEGDGITNGAKPDDNHNTSAPVKRRRKTPTKKGSPEQASIRKRKTGADKKASATKTTTRKKTTKKVTTPKGSGKKGTAKGTGKKRSTK